MPTVLLNGLSANLPANATLSEHMISQKRRLTVIVVGSQKCGTSALAAYLTAHPDIVFSTMKEVSRANTRGKATS